MENSKAFVCENCGATLKLSEGGGRAVCPYCGRVYRLEEKNKPAGFAGIAAGLRERAGIVAANFGLTQARLAADSFDGDGREEERRFLAGATVEGGVLKRYRAAETGESVRIPNEISVVEKRAAYKDRKLGRLSAAPQVKEFGKKSFSRCTNLTNIRLEGAERIASRAFAGCRALREVTISRPVLYMGKKIFAGCGSIARVILPRSMEPCISRLFGRLGKFRIEFVYID